MPLDADLDAALADAENRVVVVLGDHETWGNRIREPAFAVDGERVGLGERARREYVIVRRATLPGLARRAAVTVDGALREVSDLLDGPDTDGRLVTLELTALDAVPS